MEKVTFFNNSHNNKVVYTDGEHGINDQSECSKLIWLILKISLGLQKRKEIQFVVKFIIYIRKP